MKELQQIYKLARLNYPKWWKDNEVIIHLSVGLLLSMSVYLMYSFIGGRLSVSISFLVFVLITQYNAPLISEMFYSHTVNHFKTSNRVLWKYMLFNLFAYNPVIVYFPALSIFVLLMVSSNLPLFTLQLLVIVGNILYMFHIFISHVLYKHLISGFIIVMMIVANIFNNMYLSSLFVGISCFLITYMFVNVTRLFSIYDINDYQKRSTVRTKSMVIKYILHLPPQEIAEKLWSMVVVIGVTVITGNSIYLFLIIMHQVLRHELLLDYKLNMMAQAIKPYYFYKLSKAPFIRRFRYSDIYYTTIPFMLMTIIVSILLGQLLVGGIILVVQAICSVEYYYLQERLFKIKSRSGQMFFQFLTSILIILAIWISHYV